ncbi:MAG: glycoside hydrolase family 57 protein [Planctomycetota bacterium]
MASICLYFQVHQPFRLRHYTVFDRNDKYFNDCANAAICAKVAKKCYLPSNLILLELIKKYQGRFKVSFSITGTLLEQIELYAPEVLDSFRELASTGCVEFLGETYYHSLAFLYSPEEFFEQIQRHTQVVQNYFAQKPRVFRNTELIYNDELAALIGQMGGFDAILAEGADHILGYRSPNFVYHTSSSGKLKLLLKNYRLSDDIAFRFSDRSWSQWPLTADKFAGWVNSVNGCGFIVNLFMDYETFGEHQWKDAGIFNFLRHLPREILRNPDNDFKTPSEVIDTYDAVDAINVPHAVSWADIERDLSAWLGNPMQENALAELYRLRDKVKRTKDERIIEDWRKLQTSDHFYYMCTKYFADGDVHKYFNPYDSPYDSYINFMNVLDNLNRRCSAQAEKKQRTCSSPTAEQALAGSSYKRANTNSACV